MIHSYFHLFDFNGVQGDNPSDGALNALSGYLLISLVFVFGAMAEFAFVLLVKRNLEKENLKTIKTYDGFPLRPNVSCKKNEISIQPDKTTLERTQGDGLIETEHGEIPETFFWKRWIRRSHSLSLTTKIDVGAFVFFCCSYVIFNIIYCITMV